MIRAGGAILAAPRMPNFSEALVLSSPKPEGVGGLKNAFSRINYQPSTESPFVTHCIDPLEKPNDRCHRSAVTAPLQVRTSITRWVSSHEQLMELGAIRKIVTKGPW